MEIVLVKEKETPGTWRFKENKEDHPMTTYLTKEQVKELGRPGIHQSHNNGDIACWVRGTGCRHIAHSSVL